MSTRAPAQNTLPCHPQWIGRDDILALVPHAGSMCLLDEVVAWDAEQIVCHSAGHLRADHPLAEDGRLDVVHGLEYGAQAAAIHGALLARTRGEPGLPAARVAAFRKVSLAAERLDTAGAPLVVEARRVAGAAAGARESAEVYSVQVAANGALLVSGRVTIAFVVAIAPAGGGDMLPDDDA